MARRPKQSRLSGEKLGGIKVGISVPGGNSHVPARDRPGDLAASLLGAQRSPSRLSPLHVPLASLRSRRSRPQQPRGARAGRGRNPLPAAQHGGSGGGSPGPGAQSRRLPPHPGAEALPGAHGGGRLSPGDPQAPSVSLCPPGAPRKPGGPEAAGARLASSFTHAGQELRAAAAPRRGQVRALTASGEPSGAAAAATTEFRWLSRETESESEGVRAEGRDVCPARHSPARPSWRSPPRAPLRPRSCSLCSPAHPALPRPAGAVPGAGCPCSLWVPPVPAALSLCSPGGDRVWSARALSGSPALGPARAPFGSAPGLAAVLRVLREGLRVHQRSCGVWGLFGRFWSAGHPSTAKHRGLRCRSSE